MKKFVLLSIVCFLLLTSCAVKKQFSSIETKTDSVKEKFVDSVIIKTKVINADSIKLNTDINLNTIDQFKQFYNKEKPFTIYDSTGQTKVETYIDKDNHLKQKISTKPKPIFTTDTTKISNHNKQEIKTDKTVSKEVIIKEPSFFQKLWTTIKNFIWFIVIGFIIIIAIYIVRKFNVIGLIKNLI